MSPRDVENFVYNLAIKEIKETLKQLHEVNKEISYLCMVNRYDQSSISKLEKKKKERDNLIDQFKETAFLYKELCELLEIPPRTL